MKSVKFRMIAIALLSATMPFTAKAQDKVEASVGADFVSNYIWRGTDCGGVSIQPSMGVSYKGLSLTAWGSVGIDKEDAREIDLTLGYNTGGSAYPLQITGSPTTKRMADIREIISSMAHIARYTSSKPLWDMISVRWH